MPSTKQRNNKLELALDMMLQSNLVVRRLPVKMGKGILRVPILTL